MSKVLASFFVLLFIPSLGASDCLNKGTSPEEALEQTNFEKLEMLSYDIRRRLGGPEKGFYLILVNKCNTEISAAIAIEQRGDPRDILTAMYYEPAVIQGWWKIAPTDSVKIFIERTLPKEYFLHAHSKTLSWGADKKIKIPGPDDPIEYTFSPQQSVKACKADETKFVICETSFSCKN